MRILVVEDERRIALAIKEGLEQESYAVDVSFDGLDGYNSALSEPYDAIVLDVMLPEMDGFSVAKKLRERGVQTPILMLTAKNQNGDVITGLQSGADDYLAKPFSFDVLVARIQALLRRPKQTVTDVLNAQGLSLNTTTHEVTRNGKHIDLSTKEYAILEYLLRNKGTVLSKQTIMSHVWDFDADILPNTVEVFIAYLRAKIDKPFKEPPIIQTVRGFGYKIDA